MFSGLLQKFLWANRIESDARAFQSSLKCRLFDPSWQHSIRQSRTYFNVFRPMGGGGGKGGLNLPLLVPFNPGSRPVFVGSRHFAFFRLQNIAQCCAIFPLFSRLPPPWESRFPPPLLPPPVHLPPPFLPVSRPPVPPPPPTHMRSKTSNRKTVRNALTSFAVEDRSRGHFRVILLPFDVFWSCQ